jgi:colanic acid/amylovoran biosynthesis glycosyltransferase
MKRVLIYRTDLLPISETFIKAQAEALQKFQFRYIGLCRPTKSLEISSDSILLAGLPSFATRVRKRLYWTTGIAPSFHHEASSFRPGLVHAHFGPDGITAMRIADVARCPLIVTLHGYDISLPRMSSIYPGLWKRASLFLCVSNFIRRKAIEAGFPEEKLRVHYIGIDRNKFKPASTQSKPDSVLFVSRLVQKKGCEYLLRAISIVQRSRPNVKLTVIGDGELRQQLENLAKQLNIRCKFLGAQSSDEIREALRATRLFCVPSVTAENGDSEGLGMVFAEAQAMGVPVASFAHGGIPEVVQDGVTGLLAPERDYEKLADGILRYLTDDEFWQQSRTQGINWIEKRFDLHTQTMELENIYSEVIEKWPRH